MCTVSNVPQPCRAPKWSQIFSLALLLSFASSSLWAHGAIHEQIVEISERLEAAPDDSELWLKRGRLYLEDRHWTEAIEDLNQALRVNPEERSAHYFLAQGWLSLAIPEAALTSVNHFLRSLEADNPGGRFRGGMLRGDVLQALGRYGEAASAYDQALSWADSPRPAHYLAHADALAAASRISDAVRALDAGIEQLGSVVSLEVRAVELLSRSNQVEEALSRLDNLASTSPNPARWRVDQGDLLRHTGRPEAARQAYQAALQALQALPPYRRSVPAMQALTKHAEAALQDLTVPKD